MARRNGGLLYIVRGQREKGEVVASVPAVLSKGKDAKGLIKNRRPRLTTTDDAKTTVRTPSQAHKGGEGKTVHVGNGLPRLGKETSERLKEAAGGTPS